MAEWSICIFSVEENAFHNDPGNDWQNTKYIISVQISISSFSCLTYPHKTSTESEYLADKKDLSNDHKMGESKSVELLQEKKGYK